MSSPFDFTSPFLQRHTPQPVPQADAEGKSSATPKNAAVAGAEQRVAAIAKILVIDDSKADRNLLTQFIMRAEPNAEITTAADGDLGVSEAKKPFHLIYCDNVMPTLSGVEAIALIRKDGPNKDTPIVGMSSEADAKTAMIAAGATVFHHKPIGIAQIRDIHLSLLHPRLATVS